MYFRRDRHVSFESIADKVVVGVLYPDLRLQESDEVIVFLSIDLVLSLKE